MKINNFLQCLTLGALLSLKAHSVEPSGKGPHGGDVISNQGSRVEVKLTPSTRKIDVYLLNFKSSKASLLLTSEQGASTHIDLERAQRVGPMQMYQSRLPSPATSYVGLVLRFTLDSGSEKAFRMKLKDFRHR